MELIENKPLPKCCLECQEAREAKEQGLTEDAYCYNCDHALERWRIAGLKVASD